MTRCKISFYTDYTKKQTPNDQYVWLLVRTASIFNTFDGKIR